MYSVNEDKMYCTCVCAHACMPVSSAVWVVYARTCECDARVYVHVAVCVEVCNDHEVC